MKQAAMKTVMKAAMKAAMKPAMKPAMKAKVMKAKVMKAKVMKAKAMKTVAKAGKMAKAHVLMGFRVKTSGGLNKDNIIKNKSGKAVSKAKSLKAKANFKGSALESWIKACQAARKAMGIKGMAVIGGSTTQGKALHAKAKALRKKA